MRIIKLSKGASTIVDDEDYSKLIIYRWFLGGSGYAVRNAKKHEAGYSLYMHHEILGRPVKGFEVDHVDQNKLNNQRFNLRFVTRAENVQNRNDGSNTSGYKGVTFHRRAGKWMAQIKKGDEKFYLGLFVDIEEAAKVYDKKARELFGVNAALNFPA